MQTVDIAGEPGWGLRRKGIQTIGNLLAGEVLKLLHSSTPRETIGLTLGLGRASAELSLRVFPPEEVAHTLRIVEEAARSGHLKAFLDARFPSIEEKARAQQIVSIASLQKGGTREVVEIGGLRLGEVLFLTTPAHQFVEFQIALKQALPGTKVLLADFTNGFVNYVPTPLAIALGGYEPEHRRYEASAGEKILSVSITLAKNLLEDSLTIESS